MAAEVDFDKYQRQLQVHAWRVLRRLQAAGVRSVQHEDVFQELVIAWCKARDLWKPEFNVPFGAYLVRGMNQHINRWVDRQINERMGAPLDFDHIIDGEEGTLHDVIADTSIPSPEDELINRDGRDFILNGERSPQWKSWFGWELSDRARKFLEIISDPPLELLNIHKAMRERVDYAKHRGIPVAAVTKSITASLVFELMAAGAAERKRISSEIQRITEEMRQC